MGFTIRPAREDDLEGIAQWTSDTFSWGDYVPDRFRRWLAEDDSEVMVCADARDVPVALAHVQLLAPTEAWLEGARVHPDHRRSGHGSALNRAGVAWASDRGARVMRLAVEAENEAARSQVEKLGYRVVASWAHARIDIAKHSRAAEQFRLRPAPGPDAEAAWLFWVASDLARSGRELLAHGWQWRTARPQDVLDAVRGGLLFHSVAGWVMVEQPEDDWLRTVWLATTPDDALGLLEGLVDLAATRSAAELSVKLPQLPWTVEALRRAGGDPHEVLVYALAI